MDSLSLSLAFLAGNLATVNPCGFALLPAFLSFYLGAEEQRLPSAPSRLAQGLMVGLTVTVAFLAVFSLVGVPVALGVAFLGGVLPWATILVGASLVVLGVAQLLGRQLLTPSLGGRLTVGRERRLPTFFLFGIAYAVSSLGCTLPIFLSVVGTSLVAHGPLGALAVFFAYGAGMGTLLMGLAVSAALLRTGLARALRKVASRFGRITGVFLVLVGAYLILYWTTVLRAPSGLVENPILRFGVEFSSTAQSWLGSGSGRWFVAGALGLVAVSLAVLAVREAWSPHAGRSWSDPDP